MQLYGIKQLTELNLHQAIQAAQNRINWRKLVHDVTAAQVTE